MFTGCTLLGPLQKETGVTGLPSRRLIGFAVELVNYIVPTATEQLRSCGHPLRDGTFDGQKLYSSVVTFAVVFVLNIARTHEELVNHVEILNFEEIAKILQSYPHPHFYHLVRLLIALASNRPLSPALNYEENMNARLRPMPDKRLMLNRREIVSVTQSPSSDDSHSIRRPNTVSIKSLPRGTTR